MFVPAWNQTPNSRWSPPQLNHNSELPTVKLKVKNAGVFVINNGAQITATGQTEIKTKTRPAGLCLVTLCNQKGRLICYLDVTWHVSCFLYFSFFCVWRLVVMRRQVAQRSHAKSWRNSCHIHISLLTSTLAIKTLALVHPKYWGTENTSWYLRL